MFQRRKRIYYTPGLISLIVVPFIFFHFISNHIEKVVVKVFLASDELDVGGPVYKFSQGYILMQLKKKEIVHVDFNEDHEMNLRKLKFIQSEAQ